MDKNDIKTFEEGLKKWELACRMVEINPEELDDMEKEFMKDKEMI